MVEHTCKRCGYSTERLDDIRKHLKRMNECVDKLQCGISCGDLLMQLEQPKVVEHKCQHCGNVYSSRQAKYNHIHRVHKDTVDKSKQDTVVMSKSDLDAIMKKYATTQVVNINTQINTVNLRTHGEENIEHVLCDNNAMAAAFLYGPTGFASLARRIFCDPEHPENNTIMITNAKLPYVKVYDGKGWVNKPSEDGVDTGINTLKNCVAGWLVDCDGWNIARSYARKMKDSAYTYENAKGKFTRLQDILRLENGTPLSSTQEGIIGSFRQSVKPMLVNAGQVHGKNQMRALK